jgi:hypothetical protein
MKFDWDLQKLMKLEQGSTVCTWMTHQLMKRNLEIQICVFIDLLREFDLNSFEFGFGLFSVLLNRWISA